MMKWIIHDWDDEKSTVILKNIHRAMEEKGKLLLIEMVVLEGNQPDLSKFSGPGHDGDDRRTRTN